MKAGMEIYKLRQGKPIQVLKPIQGWQGQAERKARSLSVISEVTVQTE